RNSILVQHWQFVKLCAYCNLLKPGIHLRPCHTSPHSAARYRLAPRRAGCPIHTNRRRRPAPRSTVQLLGSMYKL
uniref:Uncharacterized protein n=1 Tax=Romanomermis culicivorax TaxID=13658 RepID=A0A915JXJ2_ROMCU